jgi:hypothetical protein
MATHRSIIDLWPRLDEFAADIGVSFYTARAWKQRNFIPCWYWLTVIAAGSGRGFRVSLAGLAAHAARSKKVSGSPRLKVAA